MKKVNVNIIKENGGSFGNNYMKITETKKLGRVYNTQKDLWEFTDKSGVPIPSKIMSEYEYYADLSREGVLGAGLAAIGVIEGYEDKMNQIKLNKK